MKRSEINAVIRDADTFIRAQGFHLPPFAHWTPADWQGRGPEVREIVEHRLGWDITDFGRGNYRKDGLCLFTVRNGSAEDLQAGRGRLYAEKAMVLDPGQRTPLHFHWHKVEDIINRSGGRLVIQLYNATPEDGLAETPVHVTTDGVARVVPAGGCLVLTPGESITLPARTYHEFWAEEARVLIGEVSLVNDDLTDNRFYEAVGRFPEIEEDVEPLYLLCSDYARYYRAGA